MELQGYLDYHRLKTKLTYWRTYTQLEVDFIVGELLAIEVKATARVRESDLTALRALNEEVTIARRVVVSQEALERQTSDGIRIMPVEKFLSELWDGKFDLGQSQFKDVLF